MPNMKLGVNSFSQHGIFPDTLLTFGQFANFPDSGQIPKNLGSETNK